MVIKNTILVSFWLLLTAAAAAGAVVATEIDHKEIIETVAPQQPEKVVTTDERIKILHVRSVQLIKENNEILQRLKKIEGVNNE